MNSRWVAYHAYSGQVGLGQYALVKVGVFGASIASLQPNYRLRSDIQRELEWMGPIEGLPPRLGELGQAYDKALA